MTAEDIGNKNVEGHGSRISTSWYYSPAHRHRHGGSHLTNGADGFLGRGAEDAALELSQPVARFGGFLEL